jgi:NADH:ubiquinone oxidoreductase subunit 5 (subunit L)/multisubunit Na+/H+ antiporter MnhA subunit
MVLLISGGIIGIMYSKSAQLPFFSRIENAMLAPTPISSLPHPSTMVISGVYIGLLLWLIMELLMLKIILL